MKDKARQLFRETQDRICSALEEVDGKAAFQEDRWTRSENESFEGGGGITRVINDGAVFEKGGVNFSEVHGTLPTELCQSTIGSSKSEPFYATGISWVIHPKSPLVPTVHGNYRYLEVGDKRWFGGGTDLTPYYLFEEDAQHFHSVLKTACEKHSVDYFPRFKKWCDEYFYLPHRGETRGIGGIFFDYLGKDEPEKLNSTFLLVSDLARCFCDGYVPIVQKRKDLPWNEKQRSFQEFRRGRYVEFNLLYDRGTQFGLKTGGRTESILMSLPPVARWSYNQQIEDNSPEARLIEVLKSPRNWV